MADPRSSGAAAPREKTADATSGATRRLDRLTVGRLQSHGHAPYQFRQAETPSYYLKLLTDHGERVLWGKDLERAVANATTQPKLGDLVGARRTGREAVTIVARERDGEGRIVAQSEQLAHRNRWVVEKVQFFAERSTLAHRVRDEQLDARHSVREHPELASTFLTLRGAEQVAERRIADPKDRARFVALVREAMAASIQKGEPLPTVRVRTPEPARSGAAPAVPAGKGEPRTR